MYDSISWKGSRSLVGLTWSCENEDPVEVPEKERSRVMPRDTGDVTQLVTVHFGPVLI